MIPTRHARHRCAQRRIDEEAVEFVQEHGRQVHRTGITFYFLGRRDIPEPLRRQDRYARLEGTILLVSPDGELITAYRNRSGLRQIRRKAKRRFLAWEPVALGFSRIFSLPLDGGAKEMYIPQR